MQVGSQDARDLPPLQCLSQTYGSKSNGLLLTPLEPTSQGFWATELSVSPPSVQLEA